MNQLHWTTDYLLQQGLDPALVEWVALFIDLILVGLVALVADFIARRVLLSIIAAMVKRSKAQWDDYFYEQRVFRNLAHIIPVGIVHQSLPFVFSDVPKVIPVAEQITYIALIILLVSLANKTLRATENWFEKRPKYLNTPVRTVSQVVRLLAWFGAGIALISIITGTKASVILGAFAGTTAILILVFQDSIKGLLANFQIHMYDLVKVGDWITFSKYGVDGDVQSIDLTTVKVKNFDKTISTVPATAFTNESFVNWRGMSESGSRRIKRNITLDIASIKHADDILLNNLGQVNVLKSFLESKEGEIASANTGVEGSDHTLNGRKQTNIGLYRAYVEQYLKNHEHINKDFTLLVRQLQPTTEGVPIEVYCFTTTTIWGEYEGIMADIFDHLYASVAHFDLRLYQKPSGADVRSISK